jgi:hypothetical protein
MRLPPYDSAKVAAAVAAWSAIAALMAIVVSMLFIPIDGDVPSYGMNSVLVFRLEHALVISALLIVPALVIGPLLTGALPRRLSTDGIDWGDDRANVVESLKDINQRIDKLEGALASIVEINSG